VISASLGVTVLALLTFWLTRRFFLWLHRRIAALQGTHITGIHYRGQDLFSQQEVTLIVVGLLRFVRYGAYLVLLYVYLTFFFGLFTATRDFAQILLGYFVSALGDLGQASIDYVPNLVFLIVVFFVTRGFIKIMRREMAVGMGPTFMPPPMRADAVPTAEVDAIARWIDQGAMDN